MTPERKADLTPTIAETAAKIEEVRQACLRHYERGKADAFKRRYHLFIGHNYYPEPGLGDYVKSFDTIMDAMDHAEEALKDDTYENKWYTIIHQNADGNLVEYEG